MVTRTPIDISLEDIQAKIRLNADDFMLELIDRVITFDPSDRLIAGGCSRKELRSAVRNHIKPLHNLACNSAITIALTDGDKNKLGILAENFTFLIQTWLRESKHSNHDHSSEKLYDKFWHAHQELACLERLKVIDHPTVEKNIEMSKECIMAKFSEEKMNILR